jgi:hypothetical protein
LVVAVASACTTFKWVIVEWKDKCVYRDVCIYRRAVQDLEQGKQVFMASQLTYESLYTLYEGRPVYKLDSENILYEGVDVPLRDVVVYMPFFDLSEKDRISHDFPGVTWEVLSTEYRNIRDDRAYRCEIPAAIIKVKPKRKKHQKKLLRRVFEVEELDGHPWRRSYVAVNAQSYRLAFIQHEDFVASPNAPAVGDIYGKAVWYSRPISITRDGNCELQLKTGQQVTSVRIDGREVLGVVQAVTSRRRELNPDIRKRTMFHLTKGKHDLAIVLYSERMVPVPDLKIRFEAPNIIPADVWGLTVYPDETVHVVPAVGQMLSAPGGH